MDSGTVAVSHSKWIMCRWRRQNYSDDACNCLRNLVVCLHRDCIESFHLRMTKNVQLKLTVARQFIRIAKSIFIVRWMCECGRPAQRSSARQIELRKMLAFWILCARVTLGSSSRSFIIVYNRLLLYLLGVDFRFYLFTFESLFLLFVAVAVATVVIVVIVVDVYTFHVVVHCAPIQTFRVSYFELQRILHATNAKHCSAKWHANMCNQIRFIVIAIFRISIFVFLVLCLSGRRQGVRCFVFHFGRHIYTRWNYKQQTLWVQHSSVVWRRRRIGIRHTRVRCQQKSFHENLAQQRWSTKGQGSD